MKRDGTFEEDATMVGTPRVRAGGGKVGEALVTAGSITPEQLEEALLIQRQDPRELGKVLLSLGYVTEVDLARALARRLRLEHVDLTERDVDRRVVGLVDQKVLRRHGVMPLRLDGERLVVATSAPTDFYALEDLAMLSGYPVTPVVAGESEIRRVHDKVLAAGSEVAELLEKAAEEPADDGRGDLELMGDAGAEKAPVVRLVSSILQQAVVDGASDIHVEPRARELTIRFRVDGVLREVMSVPPKLQSGVIARLKILGDLDIAERRLPQDGRFSVRLDTRKIDLRVATLPTVFGEKVVLRLLDTAGVDVELARLGFAPALLSEYEGVFRRPYGTILVTGPTGSGKSTTLYATLKELNSPEKNIITVEDPVEYRMRGINQIQVNPKAGLAFASALRSILRSDPDVVMIGEICDFETAKISVEAALTGHLVFGTLHTQDAPQTVDRIIDVFPAHQQSQVRAQLANALQGVLTQTLLPTRDGQGRVVAVEVLVPTPGVRNLIWEGKNHQIYSAMQTGGKFGMQTMDAALVDLLRRGQISREEAEKRSSNPEELKRLAGGSSVGTGGYAALRK